MKLFADNDVENLKEIFNLFDKESNGKIDFKDVETILTQLKRDLDQARVILKQMKQEGES
mgnify:CR=1 FL=1